MILLARHGETDWNAAGRWMGQTDIPLNDRGREQARELAALVGEPPEVWVSDLARARDTAEAVAPAPRVDARLAESYRGTWEGLTIDQIQEADPAGWEAWKRGEPDFRFAGGESIAEHRARVLEVLGEMPEGALAVCHGGTIRCAFMDHRYPHELAVPNGVLLEWPRP
ncbi:MAG: histidine phosphatase family protein [Thermoleophilaceae bacterium]|nr:histidine phosphatase family protein [Thermoleophilaceae bacterium]